MSSVINIRSKYAEAGVDVRKKGIEVFQKSVENLFPKAFCVITRDPEFADYGLVTHTDGAGSKPVQAYLHWKQTGDPNWFKGLAQDVLAMNLDDIVCVGAHPVNFVDYLALNPLKIDKEAVLEALNSGFTKSIQLLKEQGIKILFSGGETEDLPDQVRTLDFSGTINGRVRISDALTGERIKPGDKIIGLRSGGKTRYEKRENSGIMCNGLTLARLCLMRKSYQEKYPEIADEAIGRGYYGKFEFDEYLDDLSMAVGEALLSPTRFFAPVIVKILQKYGESVSGLVHNTGGGQTKCLRIGENIHYVKDDIFEPDPIFRLIQKESGESWRSMFEDYNMGSGFEVIASQDAAEHILSISEGFGLEAKIVGRCEEAKGGNKLTIRSRFGVFQYR